MSCGGWVTEWLLYSQRGRAASASRSRPRTARLGRSCTGVVRTRRRPSQRCRPARDNGAASTPELARLASVGSVRRPYTCFEFKPLTTAPPPPETTQATASHRRFVHKEIVVLALLSVAAAAGFFAVRAVAAANREIK